MLTVKEALALTTGRPVPPGNVGEWRELIKIPQGTPLSVRAVIAGLEQQRIVFFVQARGIALLENVTTFKELLTQFKDSKGPTRSDLQSLESELASHGIALCFISSDRRILGFSGNLRVSEKLNGIRITDRSLDGAKDVLGGAGLGAGVILAFIAVPPGLAGVAFVAAGVGAAAGGALVGIGIYELFFSDSPVEISVTKHDDNVVYGDLPPGVDGGTVDSSTVDIEGLPEDPPDAGTGDGGGSEP